MNDVSTPPLFEVTIPLPSPSKGEREYASFLRLLPALLTTHRGQYVAVHDGEVVDADADDIALVRRVHAKVGYVPIHVGLVAAESRVVRLPHYREYRPQEGT